MLKACVLPVSRLPEGGYWAEALTKNGHTNFTVVIVPGWIGDLAVYLMPGEQRADEVSGHGDKLDEATAKHIFPALGVYRR